MTATFTSVLVANRGEIAVRIIRTLRRLGIRSVAVFSDADTDSRHVADADVAIRLGPAPALDSYLRIERILDAARATGAQAVHPGYGFLAENAGFARACLDAGITFIGPTPRAIEVMGDKIRAKQAVAQAGVPVVPGRAEPDMSDADLRHAADEIGYPVLVKPSAGGGGKGMHLVTRAADLPEALRQARREATSSFGDDTLFLERFVTRPRHIEVQVFADSAGHTVHLGERECSLQRRHQKIVEEAPSPLLDPATRARIGASACATARTVGYLGAGTVEFIVSAERPDEYFFMEMNTRLQVEHPVTEMITGLDLVEQQLRVAAGEPLGFDQGDIHLHGHAVEARVYAEDPARHFLPTGGQAMVVREPRGEGIRIDSGLAEGVHVGATYDPMLAKVIAWGPDRQTTLARVDRALADTVVLGFPTNLGFLRALVHHPDVVAGRLDTGLVERDLDQLIPRRPPPAAYAAYGLCRLAAAAPSGPCIDPWDIPGGWRLGDATPLRFALEDPDGGPLIVTVRGTPQAAMVRVAEGEELPAALRRAGDHQVLTFAGTSYPLIASPPIASTPSASTPSASTPIASIAGRTIWMALDGEIWAISEVPPARHQTRSADGGADIRSPMPGTVIAVPVDDDQSVRRGQTIMVVEAMKMEHSLTAPSDGTVELFMRAGDQVTLDQLLARIHAAPEQATGTSPKES